jgi:hypothetical protein
MPNANSLKSPFVFSLFRKGSLKADIDERKRGKKIQTRFGKVFSSLKIEITFWFLTYFVSLFALSLSCSLPLSF